MSRLKNTHLALIISLLGIISFLGSCYSKYLPSERDIQRHYAQLNYKPRFEDISIKFKTSLHCAFSGDSTKPLLLLIHGAPGGWYGYMNMMDDSALRKNFYMVSVDRPGYGKTKYFSDKPITIKEQAFAIKTVLMKYKKSKKAIVIGRSYGAPIAACMAAEYPELVDELFLLSPAIDPESEKFWWFSKPARWQVVQCILPDAINRATEEKFAHKKELEKLEPSLSKITQPTTIMQGTADAIVDTCNFSYANKMLVNCSKELYCIKGVGHVITRERLDIIKEILLRKAKQNQPEAFQNLRKN